jgi:hypothetical protein
MALGLVAILAGVAVAYFLTEVKYTNNQAVGGNLTVESSLPLKFTDPLYPVNNPDTDGGYSEQTFNITNNNTVPVDYKMFADCAECAIPAGTSATPAQQDKINQYNHLYIQIDSLGTNGTATPCQDPYKTINPLGGPVTKGLFPCPVPLYRGALSQMDATRKVSLTPTALAKTSAQDFRVRLWLQNDAGQVQPQQVTNVWEFFLDAKTPQ